MCRVDLPRTAYLRLPGSHASDPGILLSDIPVSRDATGMSVQQDPYLCIEIVGISTSYADLVPPP